MYRGYIDPIRLIIEPLFPGVPLAILVWALWRWSRTIPRIAEPAWRSYLAFAAISLAGLSTLMWVTAFVWAQIIGGFGYGNPMLFAFYGWGFLTGAAGFLISFTGKGKLRWPACGLSVLMTLLWFMAGIQE